jgi:hypothetical protein
MNMQVSPDVARLFEQAQQLSEDDRMQMAGLLFGPPPSQAEPIEDLIRRRVAEVESGAAELQDFEELLDEMDRLNEADDE